MILLRPQVATNKADTCVKCTRICLSGPLIVTTCPAYMPLNPEMKICVRCAYRSAN